MYIVHTIPDSNQESARTNDDADAVLSLGVKVNNNNNTEVIKLIQKCWEEIT